MLTLQIPMLLALLGTALMAVVIFAPSRVPAPVVMSLAPPAAPPGFEQWEPIGFHEFEPPPTERPEPPSPSLCEPFAADPPGFGVAAWPQLVDPRASACDAPARLGLVEALAAVRTPWSEAILRRALDDEPDSAVRDAVAAALEA